jgi:hypothetical protein
MGFRRRRTRLMLFSFSLSESHSTTLWIPSGNIVFDTFVDSSDDDLQCEHSVAHFDTLSSTIVADFQSSSTDLQFTQCASVVVRCRQYQSSSDSSCVGLLVLPPSTRTTTADSRSSSSESLHGPVGSIVQYSVEQWRSQRSSQSTTTTRLESTRQTHAIIQRAIGCEIVDIERSSSHAVARRTREFN